MLAPFLFDGFSPNDNEEWSWDARIIHSNQCP